MTGLEILIILLIIGLYAVGAWVVLKVIPKLKTSIVDEVKNYVNPILGEVHSMASVVANLKKNVCGHKFDGPLGLNIQIPDC